MRGWRTGQRGSNPGRAGLCIQCSGSAGRMRGSGTHRSTGPRATRKMRSEWRRSSARCRSRSELHCGGGTCSKFRPGTLASISQRRRKVWTGWSRMRGRCWRTCLSENTYTRIANCGIKAARIRKRRYPCGGMAVSRLRPRQQCAGFFAFVGRCDIPKWTRIQTGSAPTTSTPEKHREPCAGGWRVNQPVLSRVLTRQGGARRHRPAGADQSRLPDGRIRTIHREPEP